jgi:hypothetical protein
LQQDWLLRTAITLRGKATGANAIVKKGAAMGLTMMSIYILQAAIISLTDVVASSWGIQRSCNEFDRQLVVVGQYLCVVVIIFFIYVAVLMFAGIQSLDKKALTIGWLQGAFNLLQISLGIWTPATVKSFQVVGKANKFDNNDEDDDNQQETVMSLVGQSRGLIFLPIVGFGVLLTKSAQYLNEPPWLIFSRHKMPALQLYSGSKERFVRFIMNIGQYAMTVIVVLGGDRDSVILLTLSIIVNAFVKYSFFFYHIMKKRAEDKKVAEAQAAAKAVLTVPT